MCKVFLAEIACVDKGFVVLGSGWGLDKDFGGGWDASHAPPMAEYARAWATRLASNKQTPGTSRAFCCAQSL